MVNIFKRNKGEPVEADGQDPQVLPDAEAAPGSDGAPETAPAPTRRGLFGFGKKAAPAEADQGQDAPQPTPAARKGFKLPFLSSGDKDDDQPQNFDPNAEIVPVADVAVEYDGEGALKVGKTRYALCLEWRSLDNDMKRAEQAVVVTESSRHDDVSLFVDLDRADVVGFGAPSVGHRAGMNVLLTALSRRYVGTDWIGAFRIGESGDTWWIGAMKDGSPYEDAVVNSQEDARIAVLNELSAGWRRIVAPADWNMPDAIDARLIDLLAPEAALKLHHVAPIKAAMPRIIGGVALLAILGGGYYWYTSTQEAERQRLAEQLRLERETVRLVPSEFPWHNAAPISAFLEACQSEIANTVAIVPGWEAEPLTCKIDQGRGSVSTGWIRTDGGRFEWLRLGVHDSADALVLGNGGIGASLARYFDGPMDPEAAFVEPWEGPQIERVLRQRFQNLGLDLVINEIRSASNRRGGNARQVTYNSHTIQLRTSEAIEEWVELLSDVPALVPEVLVYSLDSGEWNLVAKAYHPPIAGR